VIFAFCSCRPRGEALAPCIDPIQRHPDNAAARRRSRRGRRRHGPRRGAAGHGIWAVGQPVRRAADPSLPIHIGSRSCRPGSESTGSWAGRPGRAHLPPPTTEEHCDTDQGRNDDERHNDCRNRLHDLMVLLKFERTAIRSPRPSSVNRCATVRRCSVSQPRQGGYT
jgi:hypothetical protein